MCQGEIPKGAPVFAPMAPSWAAPLEGAHGLATRWSRIGDLRDPRINPNLVTAWRPEPR